MHTILVVDDCSDVAELEADIVDSTGRRAVIAADGVKALEILNTRSIDLVLLDLDLPGLCGQGVLDRLASDPTRSRVPIVVLSANLRGLRLTRQVVNVLSKPFDVDALLATIEAVIPVPQMTTECVARTVA